MAEAATGSYHPIPVQQLDKPIEKPSNTWRPATLAEPLQEPTSVMQAIPVAAAVAPPPGGAVFISSQSQGISELQRTHKATGSVGVIFLHIGECPRSGRFIVPKEIGIVNVCHGTKIDFTEAQFVHARTRISIVAVLGSVKLFLPPGVNVENDGIAVCGSVGKEYRNNILDGTERPTLIINMVGVMGSIKVITDNTKPAITAIQL